MDHRLAIPLLIATLILFSARSRADETQRESLVDSGRIALAAR